MLTNVKKRKITATSMQSVRIPGVPLNVDANEVLMAMESGAMVSK